MWYFANFLSTLWDRSKAFSLMRPHEYPPKNRWRFINQFFCAILNEDLRYPTAKHVLFYSKKLVWINCFGGSIGQIVGQSSPTGFLEQN